MTAACVALVVAAELVSLVGGLVAGAVAGLVAVAVLLAVGAAAPDRIFGRVAITLAVLPLLRVTSIAVPSVMTPAWLWFAQIGVPVLLATVLAAVVAGVTPRALGIRRASPRHVVALAAITGLGLGLVAFLLVGSEAGVITLAPLPLLGATVAVVLGGALAEELLFRGLVLQVADEVTGGYGVLASAALCTLFYVSSLDLRYVLFMAAVFIGLGLVTRRFGSLLPAATCHGLLLWSQVILWPILLS